MDFYVVFFFTRICEKNSSDRDKCFVTVSTYPQQNVLFADKPKPPTGPIEASDIDGESLTLTWNPPKDDGGEKVNNYIVEKRKVRR